MAASTQAHALTVCLFSLFTRKNHPRKICRPFSCALPFRGSEKEATSSCLALGRCEGHKHWEMRVRLGTYPRVLPFQYPVSNPTSDGFTRVRRALISDQLAPPQWVATWPQERNRNASSSGSWRATGDEALCFRRCCSNVCVCVVHVPCPCPCACSFCGLSHFPTSLSCR